MSSYINKNYKSTIIEEPYNIRCVAHVLNIIIKDIITNFIKLMSSKEDLEAFKNSEFLHYSTEDISSIKERQDYKEFKSLANSK
jgi:hypothetical protein